MKIGLLFPVTLPLSPDSGGEGGVRGDFHGPFYATFHSIFVLKVENWMAKEKAPYARRAKPEKAYLEGTPQRRR
jgi:hypothetical protein